MPRPKTISLSGTGTSATYPLNFVVNNPTYGLQYVVSSTGTVATQATLDDTSTTAAANCTWTDLAGFTVDGSSTPNAIRDLKNCRYTALKFTLTGSGTPTATITITESTTYG